MIRKESAAWFWLAEWWDTQPWEVEGYLCKALLTPDAYPHRRALLAISDAMRMHMIERIQQDIGGFGPAYHSLGEEDIEHGARVLACLMFGWEAKSEGR